MDSNKNSFVCLEMDYKQEVYPIVESVEQSFDQGFPTKPEGTIININSETNENTFQVVKELLEEMCVIVSDQVQSPRIVCRDCLSIEDHSVMVSPCDCRGSMAYIHLQCLKNCIEKSGQHSLILREIKDLKVNNCFK